jgi:hypothetical protein
VSVRARRSGAWCAIYMVVCATSHNLFSHSKETS